MNLIIKILCLFKKMIKCQMQLKFLIKHDETKQIEEKPHINNS
jgi:hypothetical protein